MESEVLSSLLLHEFNNKHMDDINTLESALTSTIATSSSKDDTTSFDEKLRARRGLHSSLDQLSIHDQSVKVKILQSNQAHWGKLKTRKQDFLNRSLGLSDDPWDTLMK